MVGNENLIITTFSCSRACATEVEKKDISTNTHKKINVFKCNLIKKRKLQHLCLQSKFFDALSSIFKWRMFETVL